MHVDDYNMHNNRFLTLLLSHLYRIFVNQNLNNRSESIIPKNIHERKSFVNIECNGVKYSLVLKDVVFEIKSIVHLGNNE
jgi:hypothetical protein